jgi:hypothetical protein
MFVRIQNNTVVERFAALPILTPELMATVFPADDTVKERWMTADGGQTFTAPPPPVAPAALTPAQLAQGLMADASPTGTFARGLIALLAQRFGLTPSQVVTAIDNAAS